METVRTVPRPEPTPEVTFSFSPTAGAYSYTVGVTVYSPINAFEVNIDTPIEFTADVRMPDGKWVTSYEWDFGDGVKGFGNPVTHSYEIPNPFTAQAVLTVVDNEGDRWRSRRQLYLQVPPPVPETVAGLWMWLKADGIVAADGDPIGTWEDSSVAGHDVTQATSGKRPTYQTNEVNGLPVVRFDGTNDLLTTGVQTLNLPYTVVAVIELNAEGNVKTVFDGAVADRSGAMLNGSPSSVVESIAIMSVGYTNMQDTDYPLYEPHVLTVPMRAATGDKVFRDGVAVGSASSSAPSVNPSGITLGNRFTEGEPTNIDVAEFLVYEGTLSPGDRSALENYLLDKYGL